jgi:hypothetical protein
LIRLSDEVKTLNYAIQRQKLQVASPDLNSLRAFLEEAGLIFVNQLSKGTGFLATMI